MGSPDPDPRTADAGRCATCGCPRGRYSPGMLVADLHHFLDLADDVPGPARRLAEQLGNIVRAATAGDAGPAWETALPCQRRPARRACPGRVIVARPPNGLIRWQCSACGDEGVISNWEDTPFDLRRRGLTVAPAATEIVIPSQVAAALRGGRGQPRDQPAPTTAARHRLQRPHQRRRHPVLVTGEPRRRWVQARLATQADRGCRHLHSGYQSWATAVGPVPGSPTG